MARLFTRKHDQCDIRSFATKGCILIKETFLLSRVPLFDKERDNYPSEVFFSIVLIESRKAFSTDERVFCWYLRYSPVALSTACS